MDSQLTADSVLLSTDHDRLRRAERQIEKITLKEARRYGMAEKQSKGRIRYTYAGHVFVYDPRTNRAITSYKMDPGNRPFGNTTKNNTRKTKKKEPTSGTKFFRPILIQKSHQHDTAGLHLAHQDAASYVRSHKERWSSHTVIVVDMSGSMRDDDVNGARCRSDGVWTSLAKDYVMQQLEKNTCSLFDVVSVIAMRKSSQVLLECEPMSYVLYNKLVSFRDWDIIKPKDHGFYVPALTEATRLLSVNPHGTCALSLIFFSDGKPSDYIKESKQFSWHQYNMVNKRLVKMTGEMASTFGRRLTFVCIGMAGQEENFETLKKMAAEAKMFGAQASFERPTLESTALSAVMNSSLTSSLGTKTEMSSLKTGSSRLVRTDVKRERSDTPDDETVNENWTVFRTSSVDQYVQNVWVWNSKINDFSRLIDRRCNACYNEVATSSYIVLEGKGTMCRVCKACFFCKRCAVVGSYQSHQNSAECNENNRERRSGFLVGGSRTPALMSYNVALKKLAFGEGAERLAFKFRFVGKKSHTFVGPVMVAKESRFVEDLQASTENYLTSHRHAYHKTFMRTQAAASRFAKMFNISIDELDKISQEQRVRIEFLQPYIFELEDCKKETSINVLVEPMISGKYRKFTDNFGAQSFVKRDFASENMGVDLNVAAALLGREYNPTEKVRPGTTDAVKTGGLEVIVEGDSEDEEDEDDDEDSSSCDDDGVLIDESHEQGKYSVGTIDVSKLQDEDYLLAFSHFTYVRSGGRFMVVDLQGALQTDAEGKITYMLTDPAIHHRRQRRSSTPKRQYGRTDLGRQGMRAFFETHTCNCICKLFGFREKTDGEELDRLYRKDE
jgi:hypothetical protein